MAGKVTQLHHMRCCSLLLVLGFLILCFKPASPSNHPAESERSAKQQAGTMGNILNADFFYQKAVASHSEADDSGTCLRALQVAEKKFMFKGSGGLTELFQAAVRRVPPCTILCVFPESWCLPQSIEVVLRDRARRVGANSYASTLLQPTTSGSESIPATWMMGSDLLEVADEICCLTSDAKGPCYVHEEAQESSCSEHVFKLLLQAEESFRPPASPKGRPPRYIPEGLYDAFTEDSEIGVHHMYRDDSFTGYYQQFSRPFLDAMQMMAVEGRDGTNYPEVDRMLYKLFEIRSEGSLSSLVAGERVGIIGSALPWYEALALAHGANSTYTIEYNDLLHQHSAMYTVRPDQYWALGSDRPQFRVAFSISSIEHDGLGRYGDPLNPTGDYEALRQLEDIVTPGGTLVLAIPVGKDLIVWNCHRVYGRYRLTKLLQRWEVESFMGMTWDMLDMSVIIAPQPVFVLRNHRPSSPSRFDIADDPVWGKQLNS